MLRGFPCLIVLIVGTAACNTPTSEGSTGGTASSTGGSSRGSSGGAGSTGSSTPTTSAGSTGASISTSGTSGGSSGGSSSTGGSSGGGSSTGGSSGGAACSADSQCPAGQYCNDSIALCPGSGAAAWTPGTCVTGCSSGSCNCTSDADCGEQQYCSSSGLCADLDCTLPPVECTYGCTLVAPPHSCYSCVCDSCPDLDGGGGPGCDPTTCNGLCCNGYCTDPSWDSMNCGACGTVCATDEACVGVNSGVGLPTAACVPAECADGGNCCGQMTCGPNQACCNATGDLVPNPPFTCVDLDAGECPPACECA